MTNKSLKYKVGDRLKMISMLSFGPWANSIVVIEGLILDTTDKDYSVSKEIPGSVYRNFGTVKQEWLIPLTKEIKVFEDE